MTTGIVYDDIYLEHRIPHVESHERLIAIMDLLKEKDLLNHQDFKLISPREATLEQIQYVHTEKLIDQVREISERAASTGHVLSLDMDTSVSGKTYEASLYSVGGNLEGIDRILSKDIKNCFALVRPPGHHTNRYKCSGFCIFNNIAIATEYLFREKGIKKVAIIDWDCHHGNGTQDIFYDGTLSDKGEVIFFSSHQDGRTLYPGSGFPNEIGAGKGKGKIINFPMPPRAAEDTILDFYEEIIEPVLTEFAPEFILISAGFDTHHTDRLTNMGWSYQGPAEYLRRIKTIAEKYAEGRILLTLEGGYQIDKQAKAVYNCLKVLNNESDEELIKEPPRNSEPDLKRYIHEKLIPQLKENLSPYWNCF
ncbi:MAG: Acetoin utilization protein AcuC [Promethearchaeota archaeon]|nr:MAG: Acetoin utilization protein AcuC [Candidatus Lokiarchaeota archaeon]